VQSFPQKPQLMLSVFRLISQPSRDVFSLLQFKYPLSHATLHTLPAQLGVPWFELHAALHAPQFPVLVVRFTSQPVAWLPSQSP
jgi:hypothetical protein